MTLLSTFLYRPMHLLTDLRLLLVWFNFFFRKFKKVFLNYFYVVESAVEIDENDENVDVRRDGKQTNKQKNY